MKPRYLSFSKLLPRPAAVAAGLLAVGSITAVSGTAVAADEAAFGLTDCDVDGEQYMLSDGLSNADDWTVEALNADDEVTQTLTAEIVVSNDPIHVGAYRYFTADPDTDYEMVRFTDKDGEVSMVEKFVEDCTVKPFEASTGDPGKGLMTVESTRLLETRTTTVTTDGHYPLEGSIPASGQVEVQVTGVGGIPGDAGAVMLNVAAVDPQAFGHVTAYPCGSKRPLTSNLNYVQFETRAAAVFVRPGTNGKVCFYSSAQTHLIVDSSGYVPAKSEPMAISPVRVADSRPNEPVDGPGGLSRKKVDGYVQIDMAGVSKFSNIPDDAAGYVVNITTTNASAAGYVTINECGADPFGSPADGEVQTSAVNFTPARDAANLAFGSNGELVCLYSSAPVDLVVDVMGYTTSPYASPTIFDSSQRLMETRPLSKDLFGTVDGEHEGVGRLIAGQEYRLDVGDRGYTVTGSRVQDELLAAVLNITAVNPESFGHVVAYKCGARPSTSTLNVMPGQDTPNIAVVPVAKDGKVCIYTTTAMDMVVDLVGVIPTADTPIYAPPVVIGPAIEDAHLEVIGGTAPYKVSGEIAGPAMIEMDDNGMFTYTGEADAYTNFRGAITVTDADGTEVVIPLEIAWWPLDARPFRAVPITDR